MSIIRLDRLEGAAAQGSLMALCPHCGGKAAAYLCDGTRPRLERAWRSSQVEQGRRVAPHVLDAPWCACTDLDRMDPRDSNLANPPADVLEPESRLLRVSSKVLLCGLMILLFALLVAQVWMLGGQG